MAALHAKSYITDSSGRQESVHLTEEGMEAAMRLAGMHFGMGEE